MQILQGHPAIPTLYAYGHLPHFEYLAMELCHKSVAGLVPKFAAVSIKTAARVMEQVVCNSTHGIKTDPR